MFKEKVASPRSHPASWLIHTHVYFVHMYEYVYTDIDFIIDFIWILRALQVSHPDSWAHIRVPHLCSVCVCVRMHTRSSIKKFYFRHGFRGLSTLSCLKVCEILRLLRPSKATLIVSKENLRTETCPREVKNPPGSLYAVESSKSLLKPQYSRIPAKMLTSLESSGSCCDARRGAGFDVVTAILFLVVLIFLSYGTVRVYRLLNGLPLRTLTQPA